MTATVPHVATYRRTLTAGIERVYENALDWEHLPYLHRTTFTSIDCIISGPTGWRARVGLQPDGRQIVLELALDRDCRRWISRTLEGPGAGTEIWTHAFSAGPRITDVVVDFFVPGIAAAARDGIGAFYRDLYARLYDEDESMMVGRQAFLDTRHRDGDRESGTPVALGPLDSLTVPAAVDIHGEAVCVVDAGGELVAFGARCPHHGGPLAGSAVVDGMVECPWHGYRFDVRTGEERTGKRCAPLAGACVEVRDGIVTVTRQPAPSAR